MFWIKINELNNEKQNLTPLKCWKQERCVEDWPEDSPQLDPDFRPVRKHFYTRTFLFSSNINLHVLIETAAELTVCLFVCPSQESLDFDENH